MTETHDQVIDFIVTLPEYEQDEATKLVWGWVQAGLPDSGGLCFYKHPVITTQTGVTPELTFISPAYQPLIIRCLPHQLDEIQEANHERWMINDVTADSPLLELDDFVVVLKSKLDKDRVLRNRLQPKQVLALPLISKKAFEEKFGPILSQTAVLWAGGSQVKDIIDPLDKALSDTAWRHARSIIQGISPLKKASNRVPQQAKTLGQAIQHLDRQIALLDQEQTKAALQIAPGPQRIRGLAGTGKTVLLAMKAANIHLRYPEKKILVTFYTQSLYDQIRNLITRFYRDSSDADPDWDILQIRHAWGSISRGGVYSELCARLGLPPLSLSKARQRNRRNPFQACCEQVLRSQPISADYEYILMDEAQDFPKAYFQVLYRLSHPPHRIYFAYDELQSLSDTELPKTEDLFGVDERGQPLISLDGRPYAGDIEKDYVLHRSYRCPQPVLMLAHALGLGLYNPKGCLQMLPNASAWEALGYQLESGNLETGEEVIIYRPPENSPNPILDIYRGKQDVVEVQVFANREAECRWIADSIHRDVTQEDVAPEQIVVICLDRAEILREIQYQLFQQDIVSYIPGWRTGDTATYSLSGQVTLSTVYKAKGNEAYIVYIVGFEFLYDYVEAIENRNKVFTAISRSKAWVRLSGVGQLMAQAKEEVEKILADQPRFKFTFPDMNMIRSLDTVTNKRRRAVKQAKDSISSLIDSDPRIIETLAEADPDIINQLLKRLQGVKQGES